MQLLGFGRRYSVFWILLLDVILYPVFLIYIRNERFQVAIIYIWFIVFFLQLGYFVYIQQGIFNHVELGFAFCLFVSGFLLRPKHVIVLTVIGCMSYVVPVLLVHIVIPVIQNYCSSEILVPVRGGVFSVASTTIITLLTIGIMVSRIMKKFEEWNKEIVKDRNQLMDAQRRAQIGNWEYDVVPEVFSASQEFRRIFDIDEDEGSLNIDEIIDTTVVPEQRNQAKHFFKGIRRLNDKGRLEFRLSIPRKRGRVVWAEATYTFDEAKNCTRSYGIVQNITRRKIMEEKLLKLAHYDELTGLANRVLFYDRVRQALNMAKRERWKCALMYLDLDGFKEVNDNYGHDTGDKLLKALAQRIANALRSSDTVARMGGDEFAVILPDINHQEDCRIAASKILKALSDEVVLNGDVFTIGASIGISFYPEDSDNIEDLIKKADIAMYRAKQDGKNTYRIFSDD